MLILVLAVRCQKQNFLNLHIVYGIIAIQPKRSGTIASCRIPPSISHPPSRQHNASSYHENYELNYFLLIISLKWVYLDRVRKKKVETQFKCSYFFFVAIQIWTDRLFCFNQKKEEEKRRACLPFQCGYKFKKIIWGKKISTTDFCLEFLSVSFFDVHITTV